MRYAAGRAGRTYVLRLLPGQDVRATLRDHAIAHDVAAAAIVSAVGSLNRACLRYAGRDEGSVTTGDLEVVSLSGTLSGHGMHLHMSVADRDGHMRGGHLLDGCLVRTTLELLIQEIDGLRMRREKDPGTGYDELVVE